MKSKRTIKADVLRGPFDPGGQPETRTGQPLEVSLFAWNVQSGLSATKAVLSDPPRYRDFWHWPIASQMLRDAERLGFDHQVQYGRWSGYGGPSGWNDASLDFATGAAASAAITERLGLFSTVHVAYKFHPLHIAKIGASIDFISGGRWGLNVVAGHAAADFAQFGITEIPPGGERYALADEFTTLLKYLWTHEDPIDFEGPHFQAYGAWIAPMPARKPRPVLMNAGQSEAGLDFACRQADWVFVAPPSGKLEDYARLASKAHELASRYERSVRIAAMCYCVIEPTDEEARRTVEWLEDEVDVEAVVNFLGGALDTSTAGDSGIDPTDRWGGLGRERALSVGLGMAGYRLFGGYELVAEQMRELHQAGVENAVVCFWEPSRGLRLMGEHVFPLLERMNVRRPVDRP